MPVAVTILTGEQAGSTTIMSYNVNPLELFVEFAKSDIKWEIDYAEANKQEMLEWCKADMVARILAALHHGRVVRFNDPAGVKEWRLSGTEPLTLPVSGQEAISVVGEIEQAVYSHGINICIDTDDESGVAIVIRSK